MKKGKYEVSIGPKRQEVDALEFAIFGYGSLIVHRDVAYPTTWTVTEPRTGLFVCNRQPTRKAAMEKATAKVLAYPHEEFEDMIKGWLPQTSTRYQRELEKAYGVESRG